MIKISKDEAMYLLDHRCKWGRDIHRTYSRFKHYYATESGEVIKKLNDYRRAKAH